MIDHRKGGVDSRHVFGLGIWAEGVAILSDKGSNWKDHVSVVHSACLGNVQDLVTESS